MSGGAIAAVDSAAACADSADGGGSAVSDWAALTTEGGGTGAPDWCSLVSCGGSAALVWEVLVAGSVAVFLSELMYCSTIGSAVGTAFFGFVAVGVAL